MDPQEISTDEPIPNADPMSDDPIIRAVLDDGHGEVLIEGECLSIGEVWEAARKALGDGFPVRRSGIVFEHASGQRFRYGRFIGDERDFKVISVEELDDDADETANMPLPPPGMIDVATDLLHDTEREEEGSHD